MRTKGTPHATSSMEAILQDSPVGMVKKPRSCSICYGVSHDVGNCTDHARLNTKH